MISPLLANIYLHEALDKWWIEDVIPHLRGNAFLVRYADDFAMVFANQEHAERVREVLPKRMARFGLTVHPDKTRLVHFQPPSDPQSEEKPGSFDFLGFTHYWRRSRKGRWSVLRKTAKSRFSRAMRAINQWLQAARHLPVEDQARQLGAKLRGHFNYYGLPGNSRAIARFRYEVLCLWRKWLGRRSNRALLTWEKFSRVQRQYRLSPARLPPRNQQLRLANL